MGRLRVILKKAQLKLLCTEFREYLTVEVQLSHGKNSNVECFKHKTNKLITCKSNLSKSRMPNTTLPKIDTYGERQYNLNIQLVMVSKENTPPFGHHMPIYPKFLGSHLNNQKIPI